MNNSAPRLYLVVGNPASGKDELIAAVHVIGTYHAEIVRKYADRQWHPGDEEELIFQDIESPDGSGVRVPNDEYRLDECDVVYENYGNRYGIDFKMIWDGLRKGVSQVLVVSNRDAINRILDEFDSFTVLLYVYSPITSEQYRKSEIIKQEKKHAEDSNYQIDYAYVDERVDNFDMSWKLYEDNLLAFDHVLIYADKQEDLFDQLFRLFRAYETGQL